MQNDIVYTWERIQIITHVLLENDYSNPRYSVLDTNKVETAVIMPLASWQEQVYLDFLPWNFWYVLKSMILSVESKQPSICSTRKNTSISSTRGKSVIDYSFDGIVLLCSQFQTN